jgi:predicted RNA-binding Zn-ribbon protein involved in translation (DUF1610 family)
MDWQEQLRTLRRRRRALYWCFGLFLPWGLVTYLLGVPEWLAFAVWAVTAIALTSSFTFWRCPKCGKLAFYKGLFHNTFSPRCLHCGLELKPEQKR